MLVPAAAMREALDVGAPLADVVPRLALQPNIGTLVILRRIHDIG